MAIPFYGSTNPRLFEIECRCMDRDGVVIDGAYATWAYFLAGVSDREPGLQEVVRVVRDGGPIVIVDNAGGDEFCALSDRPISDDGQWYVKRGFSRTVLDTAFGFDSTDEARRLLSFYFGEDVAQGIHTTEIGFKVAAYVGESGAVAAADTVGFNVSRQGTAAAVEGRRSLSMQHR
jgi:hypothetical protein